MPDLGVLDRAHGVRRTPRMSPAIGTSEGRIPWGQIVLLSYASILTLALTWLFWTGRIPRAAAPEPPAAEKPAAESSVAARTGTPAPDSRLLRSRRRTSRPSASPSGSATWRSRRSRSRPVPVDLVRTIDSRGRRREGDCLVLRLRPGEPSKDQTFPPWIEPRTGARSSGRSTRISRRPRGGGSACSRWRWTANGRSSARIPGPRAGRIGADVHRGRAGLGEPPGRRDDLAGPPADRRLPQRHAGGEVHQGARSAGPRDDRGVAKNDAVRDPALSPTERRSRPSHAGSTGAVGAIGLPAGVGSAAWRESAARAPSCGAPRSSRRSLEFLVLIGRPLRGEFEPVDAIEELHELAESLLAEELRQPLVGG